MNKFVTNRQISLMVFSIIVGYTVKTIPRDIAEKAGTGSWMVLLMGTSIFILITYIITFLQYVYEGKTIYEYGKQLIGKVITYLFLALYLIYFFIYFTMLTRGFIEALKTDTLSKTPVVYISILFYIVLGYSIIKGINAIGRVCEIYAPIFIVGYILIFLMLITQGRLVNIRPLFVTGDIMKYFKALPGTISPFLGAEILLFIPISQSENKNVFKYTMLTILFIGIFYIYIVEAVISVVGTELVVNLKSPVLSVLRGVDIYSLEFIRRLDGIYIIFRIMNLFCGMSLMGYGVVVTTNKIFKKIKYNFLVIMIIFISIIVSQIPNTTFKVELIIKYNSYLGIVLVLVIPVILFIITKVKKYDKKIQ